MITFYTLFNPIASVFARAGKTDAVCVSTFFAKKFTSEWSANNWRRKHPMFADFQLRKLVVQ